MDCRSLHRKVKRTGFPFSTPCICRVGCHPSTRSFPRLARPVISQDPSTSRPSPSKTSRSPRQSGSSRSDLECQSKLCQACVEIKTSGLEGYRTSTLETRHDSSKAKPSLTTPGNTFTRLLPPLLVRLLGLRRRRRGHHVGRGSVVLSLTSTK